MKKWLYLVVLLAGCATGPSAYEQEFHAYINLVNEAISMGRITQAQGQYLVAQKRNEIISRRSSDHDRAMAGAALGAAIMNSSGPYFLPQR